MIENMLVSVSKVIMGPRLIIPALAAASIFQGVEASPVDLKIFKVVTASSPGTAFVIGPSDRGQCILITAYHVIKDNSDSEPLEIFTPKGQRFIMNKSAFKYDHKLDLAFAAASSCANSLGLPLARATSITVSTKVHVKGYPNDEEAAHSTKIIPFTVTGRVTQYNDSVTYDLNYDAPTKPGYSGGPVINDDGSELMAVHGLSDTVGDSSDHELREQLRVGGRGVSAPLLYRFLKEHGINIPRSDKSTCLVGVC
jgi:S1-C subfamily serine protease